MYNDACIDLLNFRYRMFVNNSRQSMCYILQNHHSQTVHTICKEKNYMGYIIMYRNLEKLRKTFKIFEYYACTEAFVPPLCLLVM